MLSKKQIQRNIEMSDDGVFFTITIATIIIVLAMWVIYGIAFHVEGSTRVTVVEVNSYPCDPIVEYHKSGAYTHRHEYEATRYELLLRKEDGGEYTEYVKIKKGEETDWAETMFKPGNILEFSNLEGFHYMFGLRLIE